MPLRENEPSERQFRLMELSGEQPATQKLGGSEVDLVKPSGEWCNRKNCSATKRSYSYTRN